MSRLAAQEPGLPAGANVRLEEGVRVERLSQRAAGRSPKDFLLRHAWKLGLAVIALALLTVRGVNDPLISRYPVYTLGATGGGPTLVPCQALPAGTTIWNAAGSPYILPVNAANNLDPSVTPCAGITVPQGATLLIDASAGPVQVFSHGAGIIVQGGELWADGTGPASPVTFDAEPDVASWDGIAIHSSPGGTGDASFDYSSVQHALTAITIDSGATSSPDTTSPDHSKYGLTLSNSNVVNSYFDGIDATDTPISLTGAGDGRAGTVNNIGSFGIKVAFDKKVSLPENALKIDGIVFGSSVPFAETACAPLSPCAAGTIGNDAIQGTFPAALSSSASERVSVTNSSLYRAGNFGIDLTNPYDPVIHNNAFVCNGTGSPDPRHGVCTSNVATKSSPIYLNNATADLDQNVHNNAGQLDGLEAIVFNGTVTSPTFHWRTPTPSPSNDLGYVLNGDLNMNGGTFALRSGDVVKVKGGTINLTNTTLDASDTSVSGPAGAKIFTSLRDNSVGIAAGCSVFVQVCSPPLPLPPGEWGGIDLIGAGANATIANANIEYATTGIQIANGATSTLGGAPYGLVVTGSSIGPTFADGIDATDTAISVASTTLACPTPACANTAPIRNRGIVADFTGAGPVGGGLNLDHNTINGTGNEAILGIALSGQTVNGLAAGPQTVSITNNVISNAGAFGIKLDRSSNPTLKANTVNSSGTATPTYPAIYLPDLTKGDFVNNIAGNLGGGNGLDAVAFHGDINSDLSWTTIGASSLLGYLVDGNLAVNGQLTLHPADYVPVLGGGITLQGATHKLVATGAVVSSLREQVLHVASCGSVFVPKLSNGTCQPPAAGDWNGFTLTPGESTPGQTNSMTDSEIRYAKTGITVTGNTATVSLRLSNTNVRNSSGDGVVTASSLAISHGTFANLGGHGIVADLTGDGATAGATVDRATTSGTAAEGVLVTGDAGKVSITNTSVDHAGAFGIRLITTTNPTVGTNRVTNTAAGYPAIYLQGVDQADFATSSGISGNAGGLNGVNALAFHGNVNGALTWVTARTSANPATPLGYIADGDINMTGSTLTVNAGDIVKISNGRITLNGGRLDASNTRNSSQKVFTSLQDTAVGVPCPTNLSSVSCSAAAPGQWNGIHLTIGSPNADGTLLNAAIRYATTGLAIDSGASSTLASSAYGLVVSRSSITSGTVDGIGATATAISVTDSTISGVQQHGINIDLTGSAAGTPVRLSGDRITSTGAEGILGLSLAGQPVWITDNHISGASSFGIRLVNADQLVLRNNNVSGSGTVSPFYPAIYLKNVSADFSRNVRGNVGTGNQFNAIGFDGVALGNIDWITPDSPATKPLLGYFLDGGVTVTSGNLTVRQGSVVKSLGGPITISGGSVNAALDSGAKIFTSLKDNTIGPSTCPSFFGPCGPGKGDWGGIVITQNGAAKGSGTFDKATISYAETGIFIDSGPVASGETLNARLSVVDGTTIKHVSKDGINTLDTPISVKGSYVGDPAATTTDVDGRGIIASFFSPANCPPLPASCKRLEISNTHVSYAGKDGIIANGLNGQPVVVTGNDVEHSGTYGIRLVGADNVTLIGNMANANGGSNPSLVYPAIYLNGVTADFNSTGSITANTGTGNGLDALVFHGTANHDLTWITPGSAGTTLGYILDDALIVNGTLYAKSGADVVKVLHGGIKINGGSLQSMGTIFTSLRDSAAGHGLKACSSVFIPDACDTTASAGDWNGINIDAADSSVSGGQVLYSTSGISTTAGLDLENATIANIAGDGVIVQGAGVFKQDVFKNITGTAVTSSGGFLTIDCSSITTNGTGVNAGAAANITQSDVYNNTTFDLVALGGSHADSDWLGTAPKLNTVTGVVTNQLLTQQPVATLHLTDDVLTATNAFGIGNVTLTADFSRKMNQDSLEPSAQFLYSGTAPPPPLPLTTHSLSGSWSTSEQWTSNAYPLNLGTASEGKNTLTVSGARSCVPDPTTNVMSNATQDFTAAIEPTALSVAPSTAIYGGSTSVSATLTDPGTPLANGLVSFKIDGKLAGSHTSDNSGLAQLNNVSIAGINAASHPNDVLASYGGDDTFSPSTATGDLAVARAPLTVTAADATRAYGSADPAFNVSYAGFVNGDSASSLGGTLSFNAPPASSPVGTYTDQIVPSGLTSPNYTISYVNGTLTITQAALTITADAKSMAYGAAVPALTATPSGLVNGDTLGSMGVTPGLSTTATSASAVGSYAITVTGPASTTNYTIAYVNGSLAVTQAALTITADPQTKVYGAANPALTATPTGLVNGDTLGSIGVTPSLSTTATAASHVGSYAITATGPASTTNYAITYVDGTLAVTQAALTISADNQAMPVGGPLPTLTATPSGLVNGDTLASIGVTPVLSTKATIASPAGTYPITATGPASTADYSITYTDGTLTVS